MGRRLAALWAEVNASDSSDEVAVSQGKAPPTPSKVTRQPTARQHPPIAMPAGRWNASATAINTSPSNAATATMGAGPGQAIAIPASITIVPAEAIAPPATPRVPVTAPALRQIVRPTVRAGRPASGARGAHCLKVSAASPNRPSRAPSATTDAKAVVPRVRSRSSASASLSSSRRRWTRTARSVAAEWASSGIAPSVNTVRPPAPGTAQRPPASSVAEARPTPAAVDQGTFEPIDLPDRPINARKTASANASPASRPAPGAAPPPAEIIASTLSGTRSVAIRSRPCAVVGNRHRRSACRPTAKNAATTPFASPNRRIGRSAIRSQ